MALTFAISTVFHLVYIKPQPTLKEPLKNPKTNTKTNHPTLKKPSMILNELPIDFLMNLQANNQHHPHKSPANIK